MPGLTWKSLTGFFRLLFDPIVATGYDLQFIKDTLKQGSIDRFWITQPLSSGSVLYCGAAPAALCNTQ
jgi:hypothetical protein